MGKLFDKFIRSRTSKKNFNESSYQFINESAWESVEYFREIIDSWFPNFPADKNFIRQFKSKVDRKHHSSFFELYMFSLVKCMGYQVEYHATVGNRKIDLKLYNDRNEPIFMDCTLCGNADDSFSSIEHVVQNAIESINNKNYWLSVNILKWENKTPRIRNLKETIELKLNKYELAFEEPPELHWRDKGWHIYIEFQKKSIQSDTVIGSFNSNRIGGFIDGELYAILANSLHKKRGRPYNTNTPFFIAINYRDISLNHEIIKSVLYGYSEPGYSRVGGKRSPFFYANKPKNTSVTGVVIVYNLNHMNMDSVRIDVWYNPWTKYPADDTFPEFNQYIPKIDISGKVIEFEYSPGIPPYKLLGIKKNYFEIFDT